MLRLDAVGGFSGTVVGKPHLFGWDFNAISHPGRYAIVAMLAFTGVALRVANLRRGRSGRRLLAVRTTARAAAALGISVEAAKSRLHRARAQAKGALLASLEGSTREGSRGATERGR